MDFTADTEFCNRSQLKPLNINFLAANFANSETLVFDFMQIIFDLRN